MTYPRPAATDEIQSCATAIEQLRAGQTAAMSRWLRFHLFDHVMPFWSGDAIDPQGGLCTCINDQGEIFSTEKWMWSQWRAVWVFSRIYNRLDRNPRWLQVARHIADFCLRFGWDAAASGWALVLSREGRILRGHESTYSDAFAVSGLVELYRGTGDKNLLRIAGRSADLTLLRLAEPRDRIPHFPYPIPRDCRPHGIPMIWSLTLAELGAAAGDERYLKAASALSDEIFRDFYRPERDVILEYVRSDGTEYPRPQGTAIVPGHAIEALWFQLQVAELAGCDIAGGIDPYRLMLRHLELGWDHAGGGGIRLAVDADQREPVGWAHADTKLWWPHTEALYAMLLGWQRTRDPAFHEWYGRIWRVCLDHYVDWQHGEWRQKLSRTFSPIQDTVALPVKDPFHLPRSLILQLELLGRS